MGGDLTQAYRGAGRVTAFVIVGFLALCSLVAHAQDITNVSRIAGPVDDSKLITLKGSTHPLARSEYDRGAAPATLPMNRMLLLLQHSPEQEAQAMSLLDEQQNPSSPNFHQWLTPDEFGERFGPATADIQTVTSWLQKHGFQVANVAHGRHLIEFSGTAAQVKEAFHAPIHQFVVRGQEYWANASDLQIPVAIAPVVRGLVSLNNFASHPLSKAHRVVRRMADTGKFLQISPAITFPPTLCSSGDCFALGPYDFATIYNVLPLWSRGIDGRGQSIAIVAESNINIQDVRNFRALFGLPPNDPEIILNGPDPGLNGAESEAVGDVQIAGSIAKNATIKLVISEDTLSTNNGVLTTSFIVDNNLAGIMSLSFLGCELHWGTAGNAYWYSIYQQAVAQGITVSVAAGDNGGAGCDDFDVLEPTQLGLAVNALASTPFNVAAGGSDFSGNGHLSSYFSSTNNPLTKASALSYIPEIAWNDTCVNPILVPLGLSSQTDAIARCNDPALLSLFGGLLAGVVAGGGGKSNCTISDGSDAASCRGGYAKPSWQEGRGVPNDGKRDLPDISLFAGGVFGPFEIICQADFTGTDSCNLNAPYQDFVGVGVAGTSTAAPLFSGMMALVNQTTHSRQGNANYVLYKLAAKQDPAQCNSNAPPAANCVFNDITQGTTRVPCVAGSPACKLEGESFPIGILSGYESGVGYDLATGLGSVNAANLVDSWSSITSPATRSTLTLSPTRIKHGQDVNVQVAVKAEQGTPSGAVSLVTSDNLAIGPFVLKSDGTVAFTTNALPGGTYSVFAEYGGDGTFAASRSDPVEIEVAPEASRVAVTIVTFDIRTGAITSTDSKTFAYGSPYVLQINVSNGSSASCVNFDTLKMVSGCPTGRVQLTDNGKPLDGGVYSLNNQAQAQDNQIQLPAGRHHIVAEYDGDRSFEPSATVDDIVVTRAPTTTGLASISTKGVPGGDSVTLTALISSHSLVASAQQGPGGSVQFRDCGRELGYPVTVIRGSDPVTFFADGTAVLTTVLAAGSHVITATYSGDSNYFGSVSTRATIIVGDPNGPHGCP